MIYLQHKEGKTMKNENKDELSIEELDTVLGGIPYQQATENVFDKENEHIYRKKQIEELKKERDALLADNTYEDKHQVGRNK